MKKIVYQNEDHIIFVSMVNGNQMYVKRENARNQKYIIQTLKENRRWWKND